MLVDMHPHRVSAPWTWRNYRVTGRFLLVSTHSGQVLWLANNERVLQEPRYWGYSCSPPGSSRPARTRRWTFSSAPTASVGLRQCGS